MAAHARCSSASSLLDAAVHALRIRRRLTARTLAEILQADPTQLGAALHELTARGWATDNGQPLAGWLLTSVGEAAAQSAVDELSPAALRVVAEQYQVFLPLNTDFMQMCVDWQARDPLVGVAEFASRLAVIDVTVQGILDEIAAAAAHFAGYSARLGDARAKFDAGEHDYLTGTAVDSYHNVWFECHEDFYFTLGRSRSSDEA